MPPKQLSRFWPLPLFPYPHFMGFAPLDVWFRLLFFPPAAIRPWYWPRLAAALCASALATAITLPERILIALWFRMHRPAPDQIRQPVFILGAPRSGTTHLQWLLDCDPNFFSPKWFQTLAPQGFILSWTFLRLILIPFMPATRPADAMIAAPDFPSEDGFALNNWTLASDIPGWSVLPRAHRFYYRFNDLRDLTPSEHSRWCRYQLAFMRKLSLISGRRKLLIKTPAHTARVDTLLKLFPEAKFIHISRHPHNVIRSNISMTQMTQRLYTLQDPLSPEETEQNLVDKVLNAERSYLEARSRIPQGQLAELRLQDLLADPIGELKRIYSELNLTFTETFEHRLFVYLDSTRDYTPNIHPQWSDEQVRRLTPIFAPFVEQFRHNQPTIPKVDPPRPPSESAKGLQIRRRNATIVGFVTALGCAVAWLILANLTNDRIDWLVWPAGIAIGYASLLTVRRGSLKLGLWAALLTLLVLLGVSFSNTRTIQYAGQHSVLWSSLWNTTVHKLTVEAHLFWSFMGLVTAYRLGSRPITAVRKKLSSAT